MKKTIAIIGSSGAIGNSICEVLLNEYPIKKLYKFSRKIQSKDTDKIKNIALDIAVSYTHLTLPTTPYV